MPRALLSPESSMPNVATAEVIELHVPANDAAPSRAARLDQFLVEHLANCAAAPSRAAIQRWIGQGQVTIDDALALKPSARVQAHQRIGVSVPHAVPSALTPVSMPLAILFEDDAMMAIDKPAGLPVHPGAGVRRPTLVHGLLSLGARFSGIGGVLRPGIVHRLDAGTTGVILIAKTDAAHRALCLQFSSRQVRKAYLGLACAPWPKALPPSGLVDTPYGRHPRFRHRFTGRLPSSPKRAKTTYKCLKSAPGVHLLQLQLLTGRTHQARVHCAEMGLPLMGDPLYGSRRGQAMAAQAGFNHQALHAHRIAFAHPITGAAMAIEAPPPLAWWPLTQPLDGTAPQR